MGLHLGKPSPFHQYFPTAFKHQQLKLQFPSQTLLGFLVWGFFNIIILKKYRKAVWVGQEQRIGGSTKVSPALGISPPFSPVGSSLIPKLSPWGGIPQYLKSQTLIFIHDIYKLGDTGMNQSGFPEAGSMDGHGYPIFLPSQSLSKWKRYHQNPCWE